MEAQLTLSGFGAYGGGVVIGDDGVPMAVWVEGQAQTLKAARYNAATGAWTGAIDITSVPIEGHLALVGLLVDSAGGVPISWTKQSSGRSILQTTRWLPGNGSPGTPGTCAHQ